MSTPQAALERFLNHLQYERQLARHTLAAYRRDLERFIARLPEQLPLERISTHDVRRFVAGEHQRGLQGRSLQRALSALRSWFDYLGRHEGLAANPARAVRAPRASRRLPEPLDPDQMSRLLGSTGAPQPDDILELRDQALLELMYSSGLRLAEVTGLDLADLDLDEGLVRVTGKGNRERVVPVGAPARRALAGWLSRRAELAATGGDNQALFLSRRGGRLSRESIRQRLRRRALQQQVDGRVHPHGMRHAFASHLLESSGDLRAIQELLGHADIGTTQIYTHLDYQHLAEVYDRAHPRARKRPASED